MKKTDLEFEKSVVDYFNTNRSTVRATAAHFGIPKTRVHRILTKILPNATSRKILDYNKSVSHIRANQAMRNKYLAKRS